MQLVRQYSLHWWGCWDFCKVGLGVLQPCLHLAAAGILREPAGDGADFACYHSPCAELLMQITLQLQGLLQHLASYRTGRLDWGPNF
jgi:hypothetical protein